MKHVAVMVVLLAAVGSHGVAGQTCASCPVVLDNHASQPLGTVTRATGCVSVIHNGFPTPDPTCTPGAINPTVTLDVLKNPAFRTGCLRDCSTSESQKSMTYASYHIARPANNSGTNQTCELDHVVPLEIGGADTLDNIWPQCGPKKVALVKRYFHQKDVVEAFLADKVKTEVTDPRQLANLQKLIAEDWTQLLTEAQTWCAQAGHKC
jgi:hypothetical protein